MRKRLRNSRCVAGNDAGDETKEQNMSKFIVLEGWGTAAEQVRDQVRANLAIGEARGRGRAAKRRAREIETAAVANVGPSGFTPGQWRAIGYANQIN